MKRTILIFSFFSIIAFVQSKELKRIDASFEDYISLLNFAGYNAYSFDITEFQDSTYNITVELKEYSGGCDTVVSSKTLAVMNNRRMVEDFMWRELDKGEFEEIKQESIDFENGVFKRADKITIGFLPVVNDSIERCIVKVGNLGSVIFNLSLNEVADESGNKSYLYDSRPFMLSSFKLNDFIPLVLYGSYWFDERYNVLRFCGESQINPDMSSKILESIPHFYIIGVTFKLKEE